MACEGCSVVGDVGARVECAILICNGSVRSHKPGASIRGLSIGPYIWAADPPVVAATIIVITYLIGSLCLINHPREYKRPS